MATKVQGEHRRPPPAAFNLSLNNPTVRAILYQIIVLGGVAFVVWYLVSNTIQNLETRKIASGFTFLYREAGFAIGEGLVEFSPADTYLDAFWVGLLNTLRVAVIGIVFATIFGTILGVARLSRNWLVARAASLYVEFIRNIPLLLQLFFWWSVFRDIFPGPRQALSPVAGVYFSNRGVNFAVPVSDPVHWYMAGAFVIAVFASILVHRWATRRQQMTGEQFPTILTGLGLLFGLPLAVFLIGGAPTTFDWPELRGFNFVGGSTVTPEFTALLIGLIMYTAGFIAEIVRAGILAVSHGQTEAALALGLTRGRVLRLVILPQALRVIIPPMISQYLNLTKNSSLAVAIGYPDIVSIANTAINQTGQAIEGIAIIMIVYLTFSLSISAFMNWYNRYIALVER
ncbi:MAG TPA: amino acid ABC transporter permease [Alphaproteobacteria bacterium]|nr:amino acid ABC transporter permease [Alphaproteobacteria bacterium]